MLKIMTKIKYCKLHISSTILLDFSHQVYQNGIRNGRTNSVMLLRFKINIYPT